MDINDQLELEHILFFDRKCRTCGKVKNLIDDFYLTHKNRGTLPSAYSYECKECTKNRIIKTRVRDKSNHLNIKWEYPDW